MPPVQRKMEHFSCLWDWGLLDQPIAPHLKPASSRYFLIWGLPYVVTNICEFKNPILSTEWFGILCTTAGSTTWNRFCMQPSPSAIGTSLNCGAVWLSGFWVDKSNELRDKSCLGRTKVSMRCETKGAIIISIYQTRPRLTNWPHISGDLWNSPKCFIAPPLFLI